MSHLICLIWDGDLFETIWFNIKWSPLGTTLSASKMIWLPCFIPMSWINLKCFLSDWISWIYVGWMDTFIKYNVDVGYNKLDFKIMVGKSNKSEIVFEIVSF